MSWTLDPTTQPDLADIATVDRGLLLHNRAQLGAALTDHVRRLAVFARDEMDILIGGVHGWLYWEWLHVEILWVADAFRGQGLGASLLQGIEALAAEHAATGVHLETTDFQALPFYQKWGYTIFGELPDRPAGHTCYYLLKRLR